MPRWGEYEISRSQLESLFEEARSVGVQLQVLPPPEGAARHVGTFEGEQITLYDGETSNFEKFFLVCHLYGHQCQMTNLTPEMAQILETVSRGPGPRTPEELQRVYEYEGEAAQIGLRLVCRVLGPEIPREFLRSYTRYFLADYHYLIAVIEGGRSGADVFADYLRREPLPAGTMQWDRLPCVDLRVTPTHRVLVQVV